MSLKTILWHLTHFKNVSKIKREGIRTYFSLCNDGAIWLCDPEQAVTVLAHLCNVKGHDWREYAVVSLTLDKHEYVNSPTAGRYKAFHDISPNHIVEVFMFCGDNPL